MLINNTLILYAVRNNSGQYFRAKGFSGSGNSWVNDINKCKIYGKIGGARGTITWFANNYPKFPTPDLIKLTVTGIEVIDETERVNKAIAKKKKELALAEERNAARKLVDAQKQLAEAQKNLSKLTKK